MPGAPLDTVCIAINVEQDVREGVR